MEFPEFIDYRDEEETWRPNWQAEGEYAHCDDLTPEGWAWEFIRRNNDYHEYWKWEECKCADAFVAFHYEELTGTSWSRGDLPASQPVYEEIEPGTLRLIRGINKRTCADEWGFYLPHSPAIDQPEIEFLLEATDPILEPGQVYDLPTFIHRLETAEYGDEPFGEPMLVEAQKLDRLGLGVVHLDKDLVWQLQQLRANAEALQAKRLGNERPEHFGRKTGDLVMYLRILDGIRAAADRLDLARVLLPKIYGQVKGRPRRRARHNVYEVKRQAKEAAERGQALTAFRSLLRQALAMTAPSGYLRLVKSLPEKSPE